MNSPPTGDEGSRADYLFRRTSDPEEWERLRPEERHFLYALFRAESFSESDIASLDTRDVLRAVFGGPRYAGDLTKLTTGELLRLGIARSADFQDIAHAMYGEGRREVRMSELEDDFHVFADGIQMAWLDRLVELGYYDRRPGGRRGIYLVTGLIGLWLLWAIAGDPIEVLAGLLTAAAIAGVGMAMPNRTVKGSRALAQVLGFREFLSRVEEDRFRRMIGVRGTSRGTCPTRWRSAWSGSGRRPFALFTKSKTTRIGSAGPGFASASRA